MRLQTETEGNIFEYNMTILKCSLSFFCSLKILNKHDTHVQYIHTRTLRTNTLCLRCTLAYTLLYFSLLVYT